MAQFKSFGAIEPTDLGVARVGGWDLLLDRRELWDVLTWAFVHAKTTVAFFFFFFAIDYGIVAVVVRRC